MAMVGSDTVESFKYVGEHFLAHYRTIGGLTPDADILDLGSGSGRMAIPLTRFLTTGSYSGFDTHERAVDWCVQNITAAHPSFRFHHVDAKNSTYNPRGSVDAETWTFPYDDRSFDFACASSLFTHLMPAEASRYVHETGRVLRGGGRCMLTFFLLDDETERHIETGESSLAFVHSLPGCRVIDTASPANAVALPLAFVEQAFADAGLTIESIHPGTWSGRPEGLTFQDVVVATRAA